MQHPPLFSVILPTYNRPQLLLTALQSIRTQGFPGTEVVVVDDCSAVPYPELQVADVSVKYFRLGKNSGVSAARNFAVAQATADWLVFLDDDDQLAPGYLQFLQQHIERDVGRQYGFYWSSVSILGDGESTRTRTWPTRYNSREELFSHAISIGASFGFAVRRQLFLDVGGFDPRFPVAEDVELVTKLLAHEALPGYLPYVGTIKNERHRERLSSAPGLYSRENIYEKLMAMHADFFRDYPACQRSLLLWSAAVHRVSGSFTKELRNLRDLWRLGFWKAVVLYLFSRGKTFRDLGFSSDG
jgi:glycosyltransferase involved in cell wall biosynthesis